MSFVVLFSEFSVKDKSLVSAGLILGCLAKTWRITKRQILLAACLYLKVHDKQAVCRGSYRVVMPGIQAETTSWSML